MFADARDSALAAAVFIASLLPRPVSAGPVVVLTWEGMPGAVGYEVEIAGAADFSEPVVEAATLQPRYEWAALPERTFHWRVRSLHSLGRRGHWSVVKTIPRAVWPVTLEHPAPGEERICEHECEVVLGFRTSPALAEYRLEVAKDPAFSEILLDVRIRSARVAWTPPSAGSFYWRVSATDAMGRPVDPSPTWSFTVRPPPALASPALAARVAGSAPAPSGTANARSSGSLAALARTTPPKGREPAPSSDSAPNAAGAGFSIWKVSAGAGWRSNFARASGPTPLVGARHDLSDTASIGVMASGFQAWAMMPGATPARAEVLEVSFHFAAAREWGPARVSLHAGPVLQLVHAHVGPFEEFGATTATGVGASVEGRLAESRWFLGIDIRAGRWEGRHARLSTGGMLLSSGVRFGQ